MTNRIRISLTLIVCGITFQLASIEYLHAQLPRLLVNSDDAVEAKEVVSSFFEYGMSLARIDSSRAKDYAIDWFEEYLRKHAGETFWPIPHRYEVEEVYSIRSNDSLLMVTSRAWPDSVPFVGTVSVDWIWFLRKNPENHWRIYSLRRTQGLYEAMQALRLIDTTTAYPNSLRDDIALEKSTILLSNEQIRGLFPLLRSHLEELVNRVRGHDSIQFVGREGDRVNQFNRYYINWGMASHNIPDEAVEEFLVGATEEQKEQMKKLLQAAERQRYQGEVTLRKWEREAGIPATILDDIAVLMKKGRIQFMNTQLPWEDAVLLTMAGSADHAIGLIFSPHGGVPLVSPEEYFYLEDLGAGWWIFRSSR
ncbi:MAG: hypothetical protein AB7H80_11555 [Candidatus Kapaibacterium sp.]